MSNLLSAIISTTEKIHKTQTKNTQELCFFFQSMKNKFCLLAQPVRSQQIKTSIPGNFGRGEKKAPRAFFVQQHGKTSKVKFAASAQLEIIASDFFITFLSHYDGRHQAQNERDNESDCPDAQPRVPRRQRVESRLLLLIENVKAKVDKRSDAACSRVL